MHGTLWNSPLTVPIANLYYTTISFPLRSLKETFDVHFYNPGKQEKSSRLTRLEQNQECEAELDEVKMGVKKSDGFSAGF